MGLRPRASLAGILGFTVAFVVACGGGNGLLSSDQSANLSSKLDAVGSAVGGHNCGQALNAAQSLQNAVAALPSTVNSTLANNLGQGASTLSALAQQDCSTSQTSSSKSTSTSTSSTPTSSATVTKTSTQSTQSTQSTATNPSSTSTSSTTSNGGAGIGIGTTPGNQNGQ